MSVSIQAKTARRGIDFVKVGVVLHKPDGTTLVFWFPGRTYLIAADGTRTPLFRPVIQR